MYCYEELKVCWCLVVKKDMFEPNLYMLRFPPYTINCYHGIAFKRSEPKFVNAKHADSSLSRATIECRWLIAYLDSTTKVNKVNSPLTRMKNFVSLNTKSDDELKNLCHIHHVIYENNNRHPIIVTPQSLYSATLYLNMITYSNPSIYTR